MVVEIFIKDIRKLFRTIFVTKNSKANKSRLPKILGNQNDKLMKDKQTDRQTYFSQINLHAIKRILYKFKRKSFHWKP